MIGMTSSSRSCPTRGARPAWLAGGSAFLLSHLVAAMSFAADASDSSKAEALYEQGKKAAQANDFAHACPMFEQSQKLEPAIGTQFNLADCYEKTGRPATALALFREVARVAQMTGKSERQHSAQERARALEAAVPRLRVGLTSPRPGETVRLDGKDLDAASTALLQKEGLPVDVGAHAVHVEAHDAEPWETSTVVRALAPPDNVTVVTVPMLTIRTGLVAAPGADDHPQRPTVHHPLRPAAIGMMSLGAVGLGVGAAFGLLATAKKSDAACSGTDCSAAAPGSSDKLRDAQSDGTVSTIAFIAGGAVAAAGIALFVFAPPASDAPRSTPSARLEFGVSQLRVRGTF